MKNINELDLNELITLESCLIKIKERYNSRLQTYAIMQNDSYFYQVGDEEKELINKKKYFDDMLIKVEENIEKRIYENFK